MATVNNLRVLLTCQCGDITERLVEFRYGKLRQIDYLVGAVVEWGTPSIGDPSDSVAIVQGWLRACDTCANEGDVAVLVRRGRIAGLVEWNDLTPRDWGTVALYRYESP